MHSEVTCASYKIMYFVMGVKIHFSLFQGHWWEEIKTLQKCVFPVHCYSQKLLSSFCYA